MREREGENEREMNSFLGDDVIQCVLIYTVLVTEPISANWVLLVFDAAVYTISIIFYRCIVS